jgi:hypothetical protein
MKKYTSSTQVVTPEEIKKNKRGMLDVVNSALEQFKSNLESGKIDLDSSLDLDRLVKLNLLLSGEANSISGSPASQVEQVETTELSNTSSILDENDPTVKELWKKLYDGYNQKNDIQE